MFAELERQILEILQLIFDQFGWLGVAALMGFENATGITPSEVILGLAGWFLIAAHELPFGMVFVGGFYAGLGSLAGAAVTYWVARLGGRPMIERLLRLCRISPVRLDQATDLFQRWGPGLVLFGRLLPGVRTLISIPAGLARMPFGQFALATFTGAYIWCTLLLSLGFLMGHEWQRISLLMREYGLVVTAVVCGFGALALLVYWLRSRAGQESLVRIDTEKRD